MGRLNRTLEDPEVQEISRKLYKNASKTKFSAATLVNKSGWRTAKYTGKYMGTKEAKKAMRVGAKEGLKAGAIMGMAYAAPAVLATAVAGAGLMKLSTGTTGLSNHIVGGQQTAEQVRKRNQRKIARGKFVSFALA